MRLVPTPTEWVVTILSVGKEESATIHTYLQHPGSSVALK
jgi:hypothetical protein